MIEKHYMAAAAVVLGMLWLRGQKREAAGQTIQEGIKFGDASDWQGTAWQRLNGADIVPLNVGTSTNAAPSTQTLFGLGLNASWNGGLGV